MWQRFTILSLFICCQLLASAQTANFAKDFQAGEEALLRKQYDKAIRQFEKVLKAKPDLSAARRNIGVCYEMMGNYPKALSYYEDVIKRDSMSSRTVYYRAGEASLKSGKPDQALIYFGKFEFYQSLPLHDFTGVTDKEEADEAEMMAQLDNNIRASIISMDSTRFLNIKDLENVGPTVNSTWDEYFPFLSNDQKLMFYTSRRDERDDENLYYSQYTNDIWKEGLPVGSKFNTDDGHEGMSTFVRDGKTMFFTACRREGVRGPCDIWEAHLDGIDFGKVQQLEGNINSDKWESQACISCDGSTLYFASNRDGGVGGTDIWVSKRLSNGTWGEPQNLGKTINTPGNEESPFITNDGQTLYFGSDGHAGLGISDIFMSRMSRKGDWSNPLNLGPPVNSPHQELCFFLAADGKSGYFASDRPSGFGGLDIYQFELPQELYSEPMTFVEGFVKDSLLDLPIQTTVDIFGREGVKTDEDGRFFICVPAYEFLSAKVNVQDFHPYQNNFVIPLWNNKTFYQLELLLKPIKMPSFTAKGIPKDTTSAEPAKKAKRHDFLHTVFFEFDQFLISNNEVSSLDGFVQQLKGKNVHRVDIIGFSDDVGTDIYNLKLSEERAKQIALYLRENGISVNQIYIKGKGEIKDDKPKDLNRKVDVKVEVIEYK